MVCALGWEVYMREYVCLVLGVLGLAAGASGASEITASQYVGGGLDRNFIGATGWFFTPTSDLSITQLGVYDAGDPGLFDPHDIGIFSAVDGSALVTTTVAAGESGELIDGTRFVDVGAVTLSAHESYYIVANNWFNDLYVFGDGAVEYAPEITWDGFADSLDNDIFSTIENLGGQAGNLGPNFRYTVVPAPATAWGLVALGFIGRRRGRETARGTYKQVEPRPVV